MYNLVKVKYVLTVIPITFFFGQIVNSQLIPEDLNDYSTGKFVVIKNESYFGGNVNKTKFIVTNDNFDQQSEDFSQFENYSPGYDSFEQVQEQETFPILSPEFQNKSTRTYTFYSNNSNSVHEVPEQIHYEQVANYELVKPEQNVDALNFITQYYYRSIFIGNYNYFTEHWAGIRTGNPTGYGAIAVKLTFDFPFYGRYLTDITINSKGFIETGRHVQYKDITTQYIAPLMANFDVLTTQDSIVYYDDGEKFTVLWENVHLEGDEDNLFFFGVTLYRNGDIVFSYKDIPLTIKSIHEKDKNFKIGISDTYVKENVFDEYQQLLFNNYDITSNTMLWINIPPLITNAVPQENNPVTEMYKNNDKIKELADYMPNAQNETLIVSNISQAIVNENSDIEYQEKTEEQDKAPVAVTTETAATLPDAKVEVFPKANNKSGETIKIESSTIKALFAENLDSHNVDNILENRKFKDDSIKPQLDADDLKYVNHSFYKSVFIGDSLYFNKHWENITKSKLLRHAHRNSHRTEKIIKLSFDFPFYDRIIRNIKVSNQGFIDLDDKSSDVTSDIHYIAPLMSNFETKTQSQNLVKTYEDNEKFTTLWGGVILGNENDKPFTFAVTLYRNGDIVFAYKDIPLPINQVYDLNKQTKIGISDSTDDARQVSFKNYDIKSNTVLKILATGNTYTDKIESSLPSPTQVSPAVQSLTPTKSETSHGRVRGNKNKNTTTTEIVIEDTVIVTQSPKITDETQKVTKVPNLRRKMTDVKQKTSEKTSKLSEVINEKVIDRQQTIIKNDLGSETNNYATLVDRSDTIDLENVHHPVNHNFYESLLSNNVVDFKDYWADITNQKPLKLPGRSNSRRSDISLNLTFDFPFYNRNLRYITVITDGFINVGEGSHGLESTQYIAPLMANFDKKSIRPNSIKVYDNGSEFTALWENVRLQNDKSKIFTFAATLYKNGEMNFAYKNMPIPIKIISEIDAQVKVGISDVFMNGGSIPDKNRQISFLTDDITENSVLKLRIKRSCEQDKCDSHGDSNSDFDAKLQTSLDLTTTNPLLNTVNADKNISSELNNIAPDNLTLSSAQNQEYTTTESIKIVNVEDTLISTSSQVNDSTQKGTKFIDKSSKITRPLVKITGSTSKITGIKSQGVNSATKIISAQMPADEDGSQQNMTLNSLKQNSKTSDTSNDLIKTNDIKTATFQNVTLIKADQEINNLNYKNHVFYKSVFIGGTEYFNEYWESIKKTKPLRQAGRSNTRRSDTVVKLNFDFPFYGRTLRSITVVNEGFIATSDRLNLELASVQYIAPLMINFTNKANSQSSIKLYNDIDKFTAIWENFDLQEDKNNKFTFAVTLFKNGDIIFAYKIIPISIQELQSRGYQIKIGVNNATLDENGNHNFISFTSYEITKDSLIKITALSNCEINNNCDSFNNSEVGEHIFTEDLSLETGTQAKNLFESTTATIHQNTLKPAKLTTTNEAIIDDFSEENKTLESEEQHINKVMFNNNADFSKNKSLSSENLQEPTRAQLEVNNLNFVSHQFYKSAFIGNIAYFNDHWEGIFKSKQIKQAARGNTRLSDINAKIAFGFPFYNQTLRNIKVSVNGFIDTGYKVDKKSDATWYISPFMSTFDSKINSNSIKLYQDDEKFTALWENIYFVDEKSKPFTFAVTLFKNGDIIFAYKDIPIKLYPINEKEHLIKVGVYYLQADNNILQDDNRVVLFKNYDISSETILKLITIPSCQNDNNCDKLREDFTESPIQVTGTKHFKSFRDNEVTRGKYILDNSSKNIDDSREIETKGSRSEINVADSRLKVTNTEPETFNSSLIFEEKPHEEHLLSESDQIVPTQSTENEQNASDLNKSIPSVTISVGNIDTKLKFTGVRQKTIGTRAKISSDTSKINMSVDDIIQVPVTFDNETTKVPNTVTGNSKETYQAVKAEEDIKNVNYVNHGLYKSAFIGNPSYFEEHWKLIASSKPLRQAGRSNSRRSDTVVKLTFDFPYFGHVIRNIIVTNEGLINIGDALQHGPTYSQYIAPLRAPFDNKSNSKSKIRLYDDGEKFTTVWENIYLQEDTSKTFTFAATLYSDGNIIFAYKEIPATINKILSGEHQVQIGINDDQSSDVAEEYRHISFTSYDISNNTLLKLIFLQTCEQDNSCESLLENSTTVIPLNNPIESTTKSNLDLKKTILLQKNPPISTKKTDVEAFSSTAKAPEVNFQTAESSSRASPTLSTGFKSRLIGNKRKIGAFGLDSKLVSNKTFNEHQVTTENITYASTDVEKISNKQNLDTLFDNTTTSPDIFESSTKINGFRNKIAGRKDKNTSEIIKNPKLDKTNVKKENDVLKENPRILQPTYALNRDRDDSENISKVEIIGESETEVFTEAEQNISSLNYVSHGYYKIAFFSDPLYFNEHWNTVTKSQPYRQPGRSNKRRSNIPFRLSFDFPYYGHTIRNITVTNQGSLVVGNADDVNAFTSMQYIAPLMADFDNKATPQNLIKLYNDDDKFTAIWEKLRLEDDRLKTFTFAVTLYKNGDILFAYKDIPLSIQTIGKKNKLKIGLNDSQPNDKQSSEISFLSYRIVSGSIIKIIIDSSENQASMHEPTETPIQEKSLALETNTFNKNYLNNTEIKQEVSETDFDTFTDYPSTEILPSLVSTIKNSNVLSSKIKLIGNNRKPLSNISKISFSNPKVDNFSSKEDVADKKTSTSVDSFTSQGSDVSDNQGSEKDKFDIETNIRPPKIIRNNLRTINGLKLRKPAVKIDTSSPVTLNETVENEQIISQKPKEDSQSQQSIPNSNSQPEIQNDAERGFEQELETETLGYNEQVTPNPVSLSKTKLSGYKGPNRKLNVASYSSQTSTTKDTGSLSKVKFRSKIATSNKQEVTSITQLPKSVTESQFKTSEYAKESELSPERFAVKSDTLKQNITDKTINFKISGSKLKDYTTRPRLIGKLKQTLQTESTDKKIELIPSKETTAFSSSLIDLNSDKTSEVGQLIKAQTDLSSLNYIYYSSYKSTFFSDSEYFSKYWEEITSTNYLTPDAEKRFTTVSLTFDFPFYGRILRNVTVTSKGFINIDGEYDGVQSTHYIAPLMGNFETNLQSVKIFEDIDKFTVLWDNLYFIHDKSKTFTFAVTLHKNGDIIFAYKDLNLSLAMIYDLDPEAYVGIRDGAESEQISFKYYDITSDSILKLIKIDNSENITKVPEIPTTASPSVKPTRLSIKNIGRKNIGDSAKIITKTFQASETTSVPKDGETSSLVAEKTSKIIGRRKISGRRNQAISDTHKYITSNESHNEFSLPHEIPTPNIIASDFTSEIIESGGKAVADSPDVVLEKTLKIPGRRIVTTKRFEPVTSIHKTVVVDQKESENDLPKSDLRTEIVNSEVTPEIFKSKENTEGKSTLSFVKNTFTHNVNGRRKVVGQRLQSVSSTTKNSSYDDDSEPISESSPVSHEFENNKKITASITPEIIEPVDKTTELSSATYVKNSFKSTSQRRISGNRYQLLGTISKFTSPSIQAKLKIPTVEGNLEVSETEQMATDSLSEPIEGIIKTHKITEEGVLPGESSIVAGSAVELPILEQEGASVRRTSAGSVKTWVLNQRPQRRRQKLVVQQS